MLIVVVLVDVVRFLLFVLVLAEDPVHELSCGSPPAAVGRGILQLLSHYGNI